MAVSSHDYWFFRGDQMGPREVQLGPASRACGPVGARYAAGYVLCSKLIPEVVVRNTKLSHGGKNFKVVLHGRLGV